MTVTWPFISDLETMIDTAFHFSNFENKYAIVFFEYSFNRTPTYNVISLNVR